MILQQTLIIMISIKEEESLMLLVLANVKTKVLSVLISRKLSQ